MPFMVDDFCAENGTSFYWDSDILTISDENSSTCTVEGYNSGNGYISCTVTICGEQKTTSVNVSVICLYLLITPNPSTVEATISIEENTSAETVSTFTSGESAFDDNFEWDMEVYDSSQNLKLTKKKLKGKTAQIQTTGWKEGIYAVRVKYKEEILQGKLVVKK